MKESLRLKLSGVRLKEDAGASILPADPMAQAGR
jgi:hypothetical protein